MSKVLTLELSDEVYAALQQQANSIGLSVAELVTRSLNQQHSRLPNSELYPEVPSPEAQQRLMSYAGAISLGYATGADNESIDYD